MMRRNNGTERQICEWLPRLKKYIDVRSGGPGTRAEDIYGDTVLKIWKIVQNGKWKKEYSVSTLMWCCAKSIISDYYKKETREKRTYSDEYVCYFSTLTRSPEKEYEALIESNIFMKRIEKLRDDYRKILLLLLFQNMKHCEIGETLGISRATVSSYIFRMRNELGGLHLNKVRTISG